MQIVVRELLRFLEPVTHAFENGPDGVVMLVEQCGIGQYLFEEEFDKIADTVSNDILGPVTVVQNVVEAGIPEDPTTVVNDIESLIDAVVQAVEGIKQLSDLEFQHENLDEVGDNVLDFLLIRYLYVYYPDVHSAFSMAGIVSGSPPNAPGEVDLSVVSDALKDPNGAIVAALGWGSETDGFEPFVLLHFFAELLDSNGVSSSFVGTSATALEGMTTPESGTESAIEVSEEQERTQVHPAFPTGPLGKDLGLLVDNAPMQSLQIPLLRLPGQNGALGIRMVPLPTYDDGDTTRLPGLGIQPYGVASWDDSGTFGASDWSYDLSVSASTGQDSSSWALSLQPTTETALDPKLVSPDNGVIDGSIAGDATVTAPTGGSGDEAGMVLFGDNDGTNLELTSLSAGVGVSYGDEFEIHTELPATGRLVIKPSGGFLESVLPAEITSEFEVTVGWSSQKGLYFEGGATLEVPLTIHEQLGPLTIEEIFISLAADTETGEITVQAAASASVELGPLVGTVTRIGLETDLSFPENKDGNMGVLDLELGFKPPEGVGLDIEAGPVTGGGYLAFDPENERYAGTGQLTVPSGLSISVVGLITTELPDGSDGFSMMLIVAGEFDAVQLGFGFTLNGVGGLLGINRKFRKQPLQDVVRQGNLDSVLFPEDVVENAQRIISDVREIFPPTRGSHVFGPMLKIGWGTPTIIAASVGVVLEIPSFRIAILGNIEMALPNLEVERPEGMPEEVPFPPIQVNLDVVGIIDIPGKSLSLDASLYDSRIMQWTMSGDMALRSSWGEQSRFLLSIGGFNPRYTPPDGFPKLDRVAVSLDVPGGQPVIDFTGYLAVTSNTFQVGAQVNAELEVGPLYVYGGLGFDALFRFNPFSFVFDFFAQFGVEFKWFELSVGVDGTISGPSPFHIRGTVNVSVGPFDVSAKIDLTLGTDAKTKQLPAAEVLPELVAALNEPKNWDAQLPGDGNGVATLRSAKSAEVREQAKQSAAGKADEAPSPVIAHPLGTLTVRQTVVPFNYAIEKFGEARPTTYDEFRIAGVTVGGVADHDREAVADEFAPAAFRKMDDAEKLDTPDFVDLEAGTTAGDVGLVVGGEATPADATGAAFTYEETVYDEKHDNRGTPLVDIKADEVGVGHTSFTAHELSKGKRGVQPADEGLFGVDDGDDDGGLFGVGGEDFVVVEVDTLTPVVADFEQYGDDDASDDSSAGFVSIADSAVAEDVRPGLHVGTSKGRAQVELKRYANESGVDERDLQVVPANSLEDDE